MPTSCKFGTVGRVRKLVLLLTFINFKTIEHFFVHCKICIPIWKEDDRFTQKLEDYYVLFGIGLDPSEYKRVSVAKLCISKYKYGNFSSLKRLYSTECKLRKIIIYKIVVKMYINLHIVINLHTYLRLSTLFCVVCVDFKINLYKKKTLSTIWPFLYY